MNYRNVYRALSMKNGVNVLMDIYAGCKIEEYKTFSDLKKTYKISEFSLRRITNRLSSCGLIKSIKANREDGRARVYVVENADLCESIKCLTQEMMK